MDATKSKLKNPIKPQFIAPTIMMRDIFQIANASLERGAKNLTITSYDSPKLNDISDYKFIISISAHNIYLSCGQTKYVSNIL